jgi:hypothetical protein
MNPLYVNDEYKQRIDISVNLGHFGIVADQLIDQN